MHIAVTDGDVSGYHSEFRKSPKTESKKEKFIVETDGHDFEAENILSGDGISCCLCDLADHFSFFLTSTGISAKRQISESIFDI